MNEEFITILTRPAISFELWRIENIYCILKKIKEWITIIWGAKKYYGHEAVTRSVVDGMKACEEKIIYNPVWKFSITKKVLVLSDIDAVRQCIKLKGKGKISKLVVGPNVVVWPSSVDLLKDTEVDVYLVPSLWVKKAVEEDCIQLKGRTSIWAAGVDSNYWIRSGHIRDTVVLYIKNTKLIGEMRILSCKLAALCNQIKIACFSYNERYSKEDYRLTLDKALVMLYLGTSESQGIALLEAWSMDVPTIVYKVDMAVIEGKSTSVSAAPYLSEETGCFVNDNDEAIKNIIRVVENGAVFKPRIWVENNQTDVLACRNLIRIMQ